ncbi:hypothetical protein, partial [Klebsiella pneumoniae]|uniref:hypothetical protein n=1 Tax=Klebsiella pneumoniae TaxID=573 RepID=UPI00339A1A0E
LFNKAYQKLKNKRFCKQRDIFYDISRIQIYQQTVVSVELISFTGLYVSYKTTQRPSSPDYLAGVSSV